MVGLPQKFKFGTPFYSSLDWCPKLKNLTVVEIIEYLIIKITDVVMLASSPNYLLTWLSTVGPVVHLEVPLQYAKIWQEGIQPQSGITWDRSETCVAEMDTKALYWSQMSERTATSSNKCRSMLCKWLCACCICNTEPPWNV